MNLAVTRPEEVAKILDCLVVIAPCLPLADPLLPGNLFEALAFEVELEQRSIAAPWGSLVRRGVGWTKLLHHLEEKLLQGRPTAGNRQVR